MSPAEAFAKEASATRLIRFPIAAIAEILGPELAQDIKVTPRGTLTITDRFSREKLTYSAIATTPDGTSIELTRGETLRVWANPFARDLLLVAHTDGRVLGICKLIEATPHGDTQAVHKNLGLWTKAATAQKERLAPVLAGKQARARETRQNLDDLIGEAIASQEATNAGAHFEDLIGDLNTPDQVATTISLSDFI